MVEYDLKKVICLEKQEDGDIIYNISKILRTPDALGFCIDQMCDFYRDQKLDAVACCYNRGVVFATPFAYRMHLPLYVVKNEEAQDSNYYYDMSIKGKNIKENQRILLIDDLVATGKSFHETAKFFTEINCMVVGMFAVIGLKNKGYEENLGKDTVNTLINY